MLAPVKIYRTDILGKASFDNKINDCISLKGWKLVESDKSDGPVRYLLEFHLLFSDRGAPENEYWCFEVTQQDVIDFSKHLLRQLEQPIQEQILSILQRIDKKLEKVNQGSI